ncbi:DNA polymerase III subunit delta [Histidinibacterium lentulum]|uniref:DNA-directed DNA polymerase n=1 Tax=Histidinibacterium lentulum TaxID=2480588 RepID=A0A3N2R644_9RHOB|nr:DNA polymerase III subunit delta [Histidinibacterium lentulum]ROU02962.1 DNA polymerase III subunit delta [Histidinibacterium lentulum]
MKLPPRSASAYFRSPDPARPGLLIHGGDAERITARRHEVVQALIGPQGEAEMRLTRLAGAELRKDPAALLDAVTAQGFFPGLRVVLVDEAGDAATPAMAVALEEWREGDAVIVVTAGQLNARSSLRKLFEGHKTAYAAAIYDDPPSAEEIGRLLREAGLTRLSGEASEALEALARDVAPGDFRQTLEKLALYMLGEDREATGEDVALVSPLSPDAELDDVLEAVAAGDQGALGPILRRLWAQGTTPVSLCIGATRYFRQLHLVAADPGGPEAGIGRMRPPVFGPRRERIVRFARRWGMYRLEEALGILTETDLQLRSVSMAPQASVMERSLIRLTMLGNARR